MMYAAELYQRAKNRAEPYEDVLEIYAEVKSGSYGEMYAIICHLRIGVGVGYRYWESRIDPEALLEDFKEWLRNVATRKEEPEDLPF